MKLLLRLFWLLVSQAKRSRCSVLGPCITELRVWPNDLDVNLHVNNGVYLTYADLGRVDLMLRADVFSKIRKNGWYPVVASESIQFRKSLKLGQRFTMTTRLVGWADYSLYIEQVFKRQDEHIATLMIDAIFLSKAGGKVAVKELLEMADMTEDSPELPNKFQQWLVSMEN